MQHTAPDEVIGGLILELTSLRADMIEFESRYFRSGGASHESHVKSARNLLHYLALRDALVERTELPPPASTKHEAEAMAARGLPYSAGTRRIRAP